MKKLIPWAAALYFGLHAADSLRLGWADGLAPHDPAAAARLVPRRAHYRLAAALQSAEPVPDLRAAVRLSPRDGSLRVRLGLALEQAGETAAAERSLLEAARLNLKYEPRWTLAGFYARQNKTTEFWFWARSALAVSFRDPAPLYDLAWSTGAGGEAIRRQLRVEERAEWWRAWLRHAARTGRIEELVAVIDRAPPEPAVVEALVAARRIGALARLKGHHALDWRAVPQEGVRFTPRAGGQGFVVEMSGRQPEQCDVAGRVLPASDPRRQWPIQGNVRGLSWHAEPFGAEGVWITLRYTRPAGETRAAGRIEVAGE